MLLMFRLMLQNFLDKYLKSFKCYNVNGDFGFKEILNATKFYKVSTDIGEGICVDLICKNGGTLVTL